MSEAPFIIRFARKRSPWVPIPGEYNEEKAVTEVYTKMGIKPLVACGSYLSELLTKTKIERERDDETQSATRDLLTKTFVEREKDDDDTFFFRELLTKTEVERERDD